MDLYSRRVNGRLFALDRCLGKLSSSKSYGLNRRNIVGNGISPRRRRGRRAWTGQQWAAI